MKANTVYTVGELLEAAGIKGWKKDLGKFSATISGVKGYTSAQTLYLVIGKAKMAIGFKDQTGSVFFTGIEKERTFTKLARESKSKELN